MTDDVRHARGAHMAPSDDAPAQEPPTAAQSTPGAVNADRATATAGPTTPAHAAPVAPVAAAAQAESAAQPQVQSQPQIQSQPPALDALEDTNPLPTQHVTESQVAPAPQQVQAPQPVTPHQPAHASQQPAAMTPSASPLNARADAATAAAEEPQEANPYVDPAAPTARPEANPYVEPTATATQAEANPYVAPDAPAADPIAPQPDAASPNDDDPGSTGPIPLEALAQAAAQATPAPDSAPVIDLDARQDFDVETGGNTRLSWGARSDVGLVRGHNEDSFLVRSPLFCVCDGMGGHAAGEVASSIAVNSIAAHAPEHADDALLGAAVEAANEDVIDGAATGKGKPGMGCTASCCIVEGDRMSVAHVGDSRIYLLHAGTLVRITHDHSYVEELVDAGEITADEARVHPSRSIITRALGSDPDMYADHFTLDVERGDRVIVCSDGLSSMVPDSDIEALCVSSATPQDCADHLVAAALAEGGHDNVTVVVVDVVSDGREEERRRRRIHAIGGWVGALVAIAALVMVAVALIIGNSWYVGVNGDKVAIYQGVHGNILGIPLSRLEEPSDVSVADLPEATQHQLVAGITVGSAEEARGTVDAYETQISVARAEAQRTAGNAQAESGDGTVGDADGAAGPDAAATTDAGAQPNQNQAQQPAQSQQAPSTQGGQ